MARDDVEERRCVSYLIVIIVEFVVVIEVIILVHALVFESFAGEVVDGTWDDLHMN
jgi:nitrogen fixation protein FixH